LLGFLNRDAASAMGASCRASFSSARDYCFTSMAKKKHFARGGIPAGLFHFCALTVERCRTISIPFLTTQARDARLRIPAGRGFKGRLVFVSCELMATARSDGYFPIHRWQFLRFNISIARRQKLARCPLGGAICVAALLTLTAPALPAETAPSEKAEKAPTPIPLTDVASEAESVMSALRDIQTDLSSEGTTQAVARQLPRLTREIDGRLRESRKILGQSPSIETLLGLEGEWLRLRRELAELNAALTGRVDDLERYLAQIDQFTRVWNATLAAAKEESAPLEILERIDAVMRELQRGRAAVETERSRTLLIQSRMGVQDARVAEMLRALRRAVEQVLDRLFVRDGVPLWSGAVFSPGAQELHEEGLNACSTQWTALATYAERNPGRLALAVACSSLWRRRFIGRAGALALVPSVIIVGRLIMPALRTLPYALIAFFFIDQLRLLAAAVPFLPRLLFLLEMLGAIVLSIWLVCSPARCQLWVSESRSRVDGPPSSATPPWRSRSQLCWPTFWAISRWRTGLATGCFKAAIWRWCCTRWSWSWVSSGKWRWKRACWRPST